MSETVTREELELELRCTALDPTAGLPGWKPSQLRNLPFWFLDMQGYGAPWYSMRLVPDPDTSFWAVEWKSDLASHHPFYYVTSPRKGMQQIAELLQDRSWLYTVEMEQRRPCIESGEDGACIWDVGHGFGIDFDGRVFRWCTVLSLCAQLPEWALQRMDWWVTFDAHIGGQRAFIAVRDGDVTAPIWYATFTPETGWSEPELAPAPAAAVGPECPEGARP